ncbi:2-polyprenylphenol 6-hydroxylase [gamma proteobacterium HTCC5015]|nr:2-polyprenylphenol 6-hydroxylase [gamma proteobacterium HTCC5015]
MKDFLRLLQIYRVIVRHGLDRLLSSAGRARWLRSVLIFTPWVWLLPSRYKGSDAERIRAALVDLGPIFVKFGQVLSTRRDILPDEVADQLAQLQDRVPPFSSERAHSEIEQAFGRPASALFARFEDRPLASASIAQVHAAELKDGRQVVVKVLRPEVERRIRTDVAVMYRFARLAERFSSEARRLRMLAVVEEYEKTILDELDLVREAANGSQLRRNFEGSDILYIPQMEWSLTSERVIVMERIDGIPVTDLKRLAAEGVDMKMLAERGVEIFFSQVFRDNFFHADMHPGNIFVRPGRPDSPQYMAVDFGIIGSLSPADKRYLAENFLAFFRRDYLRVAELHVESGWMSPDTRVDEFESAVRSACEPIFEKPLAEISFGNLLLRLFKIARRYGYEVQPQLVLLQKTLLNIEGLGRQLYPQLDLWSTAQPFLERWMNEQVGTTDLLNQFRDVAPRWLGDLPEAPLALKRMVETLGQGRLAWRQDAQQFRQQEQNRNRRAASLKRGVLAASLVVAAGVVYALGGDLPAWQGIPWASLGAVGLALALIAWPD